MSRSRAMRAARMVTAGRGRSAAGIDAVTIEQAGAATGASRRSIQVALAILRSGNQRIIDLVDNDRMTLNAAYIALQTNDNTEQPQVSQDTEDAAMVALHPIDSPMSVICSAVRSLIAGSVDVRQFIDSFPEGAERATAVRALEAFATQAFDIVDEEEGFSAAAEQAAIAGSTRVRSRRRRRAETIDDAMAQAVSAETMNAGAETAVTVAQRVRRALNERPERVVPGAERNDIPF